MIFVQKETNSKNWFTFKTNFKNHNIGKAILKIKGSGDS